MKRYHAVAVLDAIQRHLRDEPERSGDAIKRLRGKHDATFRLRAGDHRVSYDVVVTTYEAKNEFPRVLKPAHRDVIIVTKPAGRTSKITSLSGATSSGR